MDFGLAPPSGTIALIIVTALIASLLTFFSQRFAGFLLRVIGRPLVWIREKIYKWIAPRNPFSIALRSYKKHVSRSELARIENPVGPTIEVPLEKAYAPLKLVSSETQEGIELFSYAATSNRFIVLGGPGTGKTTLMKNLIINIINHRCHAKLNDLIPVFVSLRKLAANNYSVENAVVAAFDYHHFPGAEKFVQSALSQGKLLIVLDGLDEVGASREYVANEIREFCGRDDQREQKNRVLVTCRENSYRTQDLRAVIPQVVRVEPFANHHMRVFLQGWPIYKDQSAVKLYALIQSDPQIRDICRNPLLLTILTGLYLETDNFELPSSRDRFYKTSIKELLDDRPARRGIEQKFNTEDKRQVLERVSLERLETAQLHDDPEEFTLETIRRHADEVLRKKDFDFHGLVKELVEINGIIKLSSEDTFTCSHRTIQEYFAAREARRTRVTDQVIERFGSRPDLIEVLYFYCGLINNIPQLIQIVERLAASSKWLEAGRCLLNMTEVLDEQIVEKVARGLHNKLDNATPFGPALEILSSLAQRSVQEFKPARKHFSDVIDRMAKGSDARDASALESALATSPEVAMRIIPGLLNHSSPRWQSAAVRLLRDIGTDEALDRLVQLLDERNTTVRIEAAKVLADLLKSRNRDLKERAALLLERKDSVIWPLEDFFPGRLALRIAESLKSFDQTNNRAIDCAVEALKAKDMGDQRFLRKWCKVPRDLKLRRFWINVGKIFSKMGFACIIILLLTSFLSLLWLESAEKMMILETNPLQIQIVETTFLENFIAEAHRVVSEVEQKYPPNASGFSRILPWNWNVEPVIPDSSIEVFELIKNVKYFQFDPYNVQINSVQLKMLSRILTNKTFASFEAAVLGIKQYLPTLHGRFYLVFVRLQRGSFSSVLPEILLMLAITLAMLFSSVILFRSFQSKKSRKRFFLMINVMLTFSLVTLSFILSMSGTLTFYVQFLPFIIPVAFILVGYIMQRLSWPNNSLLSVVDDVLPMHISGSDGSYSSVSEK